MPVESSIFELLETLESEVHAIRARNTALQAELQIAQQRSSSSVPGPVKRRNRKPVRRGAKKVKKVPVQASLSLEETNQSAAGEAGDGAAALGKRKALGRSILQLRRSAAKPEIPNQQNHQNASAG